MTGAAVVARDLVLGYGAQVALSASTFRVPAGRITAVIGPNGSGKSTLMSAIAGLLEPTSGTLEVAALRHDARRIAYVLQTTKVNESLPVTVEEVVRMGRYATTGWFRPLRAPDHAAVSEAMERTGVTDLRGQQLHHLSGGQRQRVYVAQGLVQDHDLLLLDEPLTGIDLPTARAIDQIIHDETDRGCTVILTTHDLSEAGAADHVVLLAGRVVAEGPPDQVLDAANLAAAYGAALLHLGEEVPMLDDAAHRPVDDRHVHRPVHTEPDPGDLHHG